jgi:hypothetical protein
MPDENHEEECNCNREQSPELKDIIESIKRFIVSNKGKTAFICNIVSFKEDACSCCEEDTDDIINAESLMAYGDIDTLRMMCEEMRTAVEDEKDSHGWVNI